MRIRHIAIMFAASFVSVFATSCSRSDADAPSAQIAGRFGANPAAGATFDHDGIKFYYETYGKGDPLLLIHGNGGSIGDLSAQITEFSKRYRVIAMDSRDHGRSGDSSGALGYEAMADDQIALLDHLKIAQADVLGWSDGGIEALLLGQRHPDRVKKLVAMAANLNPQAVWPETGALVTELKRQAEASDPASVQGRRDRKAITLLLTQPQIDPNSLSRVTAPTLILAGDHDLILDTHTLEIFHHLPNAQLGIFPDAVHTVPYDDPARFNAAVERFLSEPFAKRDRIGDVLKSLGAIKAAQQ
jgi:pimeloyl-ACP methyl ester carboxylesterase